MQQYLFKDRGAPNFIPQAPMLLYRDLDTNEFYFSRGSSYVSDWGTPMIDKQALQTILNSFDPYANGAPPKEIVRLNVRQPEEGGQRIVELDVSYDQHGGRFIWIEDPYLSNDQTDILFNEDEGLVVRPFEEIQIFNNTDGPMRFSSSDYNEVIYANLRAGQIAPQGMVTLKMLENSSNESARRRWVVWGDLQDLPT